MSYIHWILLNVKPRTILHRCLQTSQSLELQSTVKNYSKSSENTPQVPINTIKDLHSASNQAENGVIYDKKPFRMTCEKGKKYTWCLCGKSKNQPLCDGTHRNIHLRITQRPIRFEVPETKEYWLCNCKQTSNRPFCDGTHKQQRIQEAIK